MNVAGLPVGGDRPLLVIAGPCAIESESIVLASAEKLKRIAERVGCPLIFKASVDKANRSSLASFRGLGLDEGLRVLERVKREHELPVLTDVHETTPLAAVAQVADVLQTPALLCRQTDFIVAVASQGLPVNLKKGQFLSPAEMANVVAKARAAGNERLLVCERGFAFGYGDLVVDMRSLATLRQTGCPVIFDCSHSVQRPGGRGASSAGARAHIPVLARAAVGAGVAGVFIETHPEPAAARCDGDIAWPLSELETLLKQLQRIDGAVKAEPYLEDGFDDSGVGRPARATGG